MTMNKEMEKWSDNSKDVVVHSGTWMNIGYIGVKHEDGSVSIHYEPIERKFIRDYVEKSGVYSLSQYVDNASIDLLAKEQLSEATDMTWYELEEEWEYTRQQEQLYRSNRAWKHYMLVKKGIVMTDSFKDAGVY